MVAEVRSYELKASKHELKFKSASSNSRVRGSNTRVQESVNENSSKQS